MVRADCEAARTKTTGSRAHGRRGHGPSPSALTEVAPAPWWAGVPRALFPWDDRRCDQ